MSKLPVDADSENAGLGVQVHPVRSRVGSQRRWLPGPEEASAGPPEGLPELQVAVLEYPQKE